MLRDVAFHSQTVALEGAKHVESQFINGTKYVYVSAVDSNAIQVFKEDEVVEESNP